MGGLDNLDLAKGFKADTGANFQLLWDGSFDAWRALGVSRQHTVIVFDGDGNQVDTWRGFDGPRILSALS